MENTAIKRSESWDFTYLHHTPKIATMWLYEYIAVQAYKVINCCKAGCLVLERSKLLRCCKAVFIVKIRKSFHDWLQCLFSSKWLSSCPVNPCSLSCPQCLQEPNLTQPNPLYCISTLVSPMPIHLFLSVHHPKLCTTPNSNPPLKVFRDKHQFEQLLSQAHFLKYLTSSAAVRGQRPASLRAVKPIRVRAVSSLGFILRSLRMSSSNSSPSPGRQPVRTHTSFSSLKCTAKYDPWLHILAANLSPNSWIGAVNLSAWNATCNYN